MYPIFDPLYMLFWLPGLVLALGAQFMVKSAFARYAKVPNRRNMTGAEAARRILDANGLQSVTIEGARGALGDHYDPRGKVLRLSDEVYRGRSLASVGVAAHEAGHALQDQVGYAPMRWRAGLVPIVNIGSQLAFPLLLFGMIIKAAGLMKLGVLLFGGVVLFQLVTLPVEFNASSRAMALLGNTGILSRDEMGGVRSVLTAAALTYVAAAISSILQLLYFMLRSGMLGGSSDD